MDKVNWKDLREGDRVRVTFEGVTTTHTYPDGEKVPALYADSGMLFTLCSHLVSQAATITRLSPEPTLSDEELADAIFAEAKRRGCYGAGLFDTAARLAREGWTPPPPVDEADKAAMHAAFVAGMATAKRLLSSEHTFQPTYIGMAVTQDALRAYQDAGKASQ